MRARQFSGKTVVITGASSGLGRATAVEFAKRGAQVGLIARGKEGLESLSQVLRTLCCEPEICLVDVADATAMREAARQIAERFGGIDVWVNNAGISVYGEIDKVPLSELRRVMDVNFFGQVNGVRAALPFLENSRSGGRIIGVLSVLGEAAVPLQSVYTASKHALFGLYKSVNQELLHRRSRVRISTIFAPSMATPFFDHAKTYLGYRPKPVGPVYPPERYARLIVEEALKPRFKSVHGAQARAGLFFFRHFLDLSNRFQARTAYRGQRGSEPKGISGGDNLFQPVTNLFTVRGSYPPTPGVGAFESLIRTLAYAVGLGAAVELVRRGVVLDLDARELRIQRHVERAHSRPASPEKESA